jgi:RNA polymerase sigma-70 factor, ECF subfamily
VTNERSGDLVARWRQGDEQAAAELFHRYRDRLVALARCRLPVPLTRRVDAEDVVQSVYRVFFVNARDGRYDFQRGGDLWHLLVVLTLHKLNDQAKQNARQKRAVGREQSLDGTAGAATPEAVFGHEPSPLELAALADELQQLMGRLDSVERQVLELRLQGHNLETIAVRVGRSLRTVCRAVEQIKRELRLRGTDPAREG